MKLFIIICSMVISNMADARCLFKIPIRIDASYSRCEQEVITNALYNWERASNNRICFEISITRIEIEELFTYRSDGLSTIYNNNLWEQFVAIWVYNCYGNCVGLTMNDKIFNAPDIFILEKYDLSHLITHETGHLIGLDHSQDRKDIMFGYVRKSSTISDNDIKMINCLINNNEVLSWHSKCQYKGKRDVVVRKRENKIRHF